MDIWMEYLTTLAIENPLAIPIAFIIIVWITERFGIPIAKYFKKSQDQIVTIAQTAQQTHAEDAARNDAKEQSLIELLTDFAGIMKGSLEALKILTTKTDASIEEIKQQIDTLTKQTNRMDRRIKLIAKYMRFEQQPNIRKLVTDMVAISENTDQILKICEKPNSIQQEKKIA